MQQKDRRRQKKLSPPHAHTHTLASVFSSAFSVFRGVSRVSREKEQRAKAESQAKPRKAQLSSLAPVVALNAAAVCGQQQPDSYPMYVF